ncbi:MAG TPA: RNA methyltransferase [Bacteroidales bacterium]|nr:RNA methyltransferase [Bacteroidales bacterium]
MRKRSMCELGRKTTEEHRKSEKFPLVIVLDNIRSMMNIGSVFRTADAFLIESVFLCGITATPPHREIQKTALGATETVNWKYFGSTVDAIHQLLAEGYVVLALEQVEKSINLKDFTPKTGQPYALVFGNEVMGVSDEALRLCEGCLEIPQFGTKHSLNIAVAVGIVVWDFYNKSN